MLRCIQVDLSTFGQDTYGLVYSMSNPLVDHDVNLLCLSTLRTANVLVMQSFNLRVTEGLGTVLENIAYRYSHKRLFFFFFAALFTSGS